MALLCACLGTANQALASERAEPFGLVLKLSGPLQLTPLDLAAEPADVWDALRRGFAIPDLNTPDVRVQKKRLLANPKSLTTTLERARPYLHYIVQECEKRGLPTELALIPFIESQFNPMARSPSKAVGLWQFVPGTARQFDLEQNQWVDQRRDVIESTRAALDYLTYLYDFHGDWHLALISYNWGEGAVQRAVQKVERAGLEPILPNLELPAETRQYVPKLQAFKNLILTPHDYALGLPAIPNSPYFKQIPKNRDLDLRELARASGISLSELRELNASLNQPFVVAAYTNTLLVPAHRVEQVRQGLQRTQTVSVLQDYVVQAGDNLGAIAQRFKVSLRELKRVNGLQNNLIRPGVRLIIPGGTRVSAGGWPS